MSLLSTKPTSNCWSIILALHTRRQQTYFAQLILSATAWFTALFTSVRLIFRVTYQKTNHDQLSPLLFYPSLLFALQRKGGRSSHLHSLSLVVQLVLNNSDNTIFINDFCSWWEFCLRADKDVGKLLGCGGERESRTKVTI